MTRSPRPPQSDLFGQATTESTGVDLTILPQGNKPLSKEQVVFNRLLRQVRALRDKLAAWTAFETRHHQRVLSELLPLHAEINTARRKLILSIGDILTGTARGFPPNRSEHRSLAHYLVQLAQAQLEFTPDDAEIEALHDRYADLSFAEDQELEREMTREVAQQMFGVEIEDELLGGSAEDIMAAGARKAQAAAEREAADRAARQPGNARDDARAARKAAAAEQAAKAMSQSVREVYRKLASALHPDRASDEADRVRRHAAMQRINLAYEEGDLLSLLSLQLEIEQIDSEHLAQVSKARLGHYNAVLREQARELELEMYAITHRYAQGRPLAITPAGAEKQLQRDIADARRAIREIQAHHARLLDPRQRKALLKEYARSLREEERMDEELAGIFDTLDPFGVDFDIDRESGPWSGAPPARARRRKRRR